MCTAGHVDGWDRLWNGALASLARSSDRAPLTRRSRARAQRRSRRPAGPHSSRLHALCLHRMRRAASRGCSGRVPERDVTGERMREQAQTQPPSAEHDRVLRSMDELILEALRFIPQARVEETVRRWLPYRNGSPDVRDETRILADALGFATDLVLFTKSTGGMTAIDRLARHQKPKNRDEAAAMEALRQTRFRVMRVEEREDRCVVRLLDLASGESLRVLGEHIPAPCTGLSLVGRTASLGGGTWALVGPITPL